MEIKGEYRTTEHDEQVAVFEWALTMQAQYPALGLLYAIPNGAYKSMSAANKFKAEGLKSGVPDICLPVGKYIRDMHLTIEQLYHALYIEMKRPGGKVSPAQQVWLDYLDKFGNYACVCYSADEAIAKIKWYLGIESESER